MMIRARLGVLAMAALGLAACNPGPSTSGQSNSGQSNSGEPASAPIEAVSAFVGGTIYTGRSPTETVGAVAVGADGRIVWIGDAADLTGEVTAQGLTVTDLGGAFMYPGFTDAHAHLLGIGQRELTLDLTGTASIVELATRIEAEADGLPEGQVIAGRGWIETGWPEGRMPTAADLDAVIGDRPVILFRSDGHALVASTAALRAAGITATTPDPDGGSIERGPDGAPTGILIDNAMSLVMPLIAKPSEADLVAAYVIGAEVYLSRGWTGMHNMSVPPAHAPLLQRLALEERINLRIYNAFDASGFEIAAKRQYETDLVTNRAVKVYMDGALGSRGARLSEPYSDRPDTSGLTLLTKDDTIRFMSDALQQGVQLSVHAIGDAGNRMALDWMEEAMDLIPEAERKVPSPRWRIEHAQILHVSDIPRFSALGVIASMQPSHAIGDLFFAPARLGLARLDGAYAWRSLIDAGAIIAGGSDAPVEVGSPLIEFYAATQRRALDGTSGEGWHPEQAVTRFEALQMLTIWPAFAAFREDDLGTIEVGKIADFSVFDRDLMTVPGPEILETQALMTIVAGQIVYRR